MAGARMLSNFPTSIVVHGMALNVTVQSYDQQMDFGLMADAAAMPDVRLLADALRVAFDDLCLLDAELSKPPTLTDTGRAVAGAVAEEAGRRLRGGLGSVGNLVGGMVGGVVKRAVAGAVSGTVAAGRTKAAAKPASKVAAKPAKPANAAATKRSRAAGA
jgi:hypothetical protein